MKTAIHPTSGESSCVKGSRIRREAHASSKGKTTDSLADFIGTAVANGDCMKAKALLPFSLIMATLVAASLQTQAQGTMVFDQQSATGPNSPAPNDFLNIQEDSPLTQSFIPSLSAIGFVQFEFWDIANNGNSGATVYVNLWAGSPNVNSATLLGSTASVYMPNGFVNSGLGFAGITNFYFSTPVTLTPGQTYYLQPVVQSGDDPWDIGAVGDTYSNGQLYGGAGGFTAPFQPSTDLWFREGIVAVPEPTILALIGVGSILAFGFRRRSKLFILSISGALLLGSAYAQDNDSIVQITAEAEGLTQLSADEIPACDSTIPQS